MTIPFSQGGTIKDPTLKGIAEKCEEIKIARPTRMISFKTSKEIYERLEAIQALCTEIDARMHDQ